MSFIQTAETASTLMYSTPIKVKKLDTKNKFQKMLDAHVGRVEMDRCPIKLTSQGLHSLSSDPYRAGLQIQGFEKTKIQEMLEITVLGHAQAE